MTQALILANALAFCDSSVASQAAAELRAQLARIAELEAQLAAVQQGVPAQDIEAKIGELLALARRMVRAALDADNKTEMQEIKAAIDSEVEFERTLRNTLADTHPTQQGLADAGMYYLQDARWSGMVGNCPSFWRPDGNGYTTNLDEAGRFTHEEAMAQHRSRSTDLPWLCSEVDKLRHPTVDVQHMPRSWDAQRAALAAQAGAQP